MFNFFTTEIRAYSVAAHTAAEAYQTGDVETAQRSQATAATGCATVARYLLQPFYADRLSEQERGEVARAIGNLRASLNRIEPKPDC